MDFRRGAGKFLLAAVSLLFSGCEEKNIAGGDPGAGPSGNGYFDYATTRDVSVNIDFGLDDYVVLFDIYDEDPFRETSEEGWEKKDILPVYRGAADKNGVYSGRITLPAYVSEVWLTSDYLGVVSPGKLEITGNTIRFDQKEFVRNLRLETTAASATGNGHTYPDGFMLLGDWSELGAPDYMLPELADPPASTLYKIVNTYRKAADYTVTGNHPEFFDGNMSSDLSITKPTRVNLVFLNSSAAWNNTVGYYTYPTGQIPAAESQIKKIVAFPNASPLYLRGKRKGELLFGHQVQLKYWDGEKFCDEFPAGVTIGWFLQGMGFNGGNIVNGRGTRYSTKSLNQDGRQRVVSLRDSDTGQIVSIGFEDNIDFDYCDATFYVAIEQKDAIDTGTLPDLPDTDGPVADDNKTVYYGTLTFEDLWPAKGDYDMNDVVIDYTSTVYKTIVGNQVTKITDEFIPRHSGGSFRNGFGYRFDELAATDIRKITVDGPVISEYTETGNMESGQSHPTLILFDNINPVIGQKFKVTITLNDVDESMVKPPYNPFIIANGKRGREVHPVGYRPTDKADLSDLGSQEDVSQSEKGIYYISKEGMPFAIHLSRIKDFPVPQEGTRINISYPYFESWVNSQGKQHADWYKHPAE